VIAVKKGTRALPRENKTHAGWPSVQDGDVVCETACGRTWLLGACFTTKAPVTCVECRRVLESLLEGMED